MILNFVEIITSVPEHIYFEVYVIKTVNNMSK